MGKDKLILGLVQQLANVLIKDGDIKIEPKLLREDDKFYFIIGSKYGRYKFDIEDVNMSSKISLLPRIFDKEFIGTKRENERKINLFLDNEKEFEVLVRGMFAVKNNFAILTFKKRMSSRYPKLSKEIRAVFNAYKLNILKELLW